jgi:hypothetical protein
MQTNFARRADVHRGPLANGFETLENPDLVGAVVVGLPLSVGPRNGVVAECCVRLIRFRLIRLLFGVFHVFLQSYGRPVPLGATLLDAWPRPAAGA